MTGSQEADRTGDSPTSMRNLHTHIGQTFHMPVSCYKSLMSMFKCKGVNYTGLRDSFSSESCCSARSCAVKGCRWTTDIVSLAQVEDGEAGGAGP